MPANEANIVHQPMWERRGSGRPDHLAVISQTAALAKAAIAAEIRSRAGSVLPQARPL